MKKAVVFVAFFSFTCTIVSTAGEELNIIYEQPCCDKDKLRCAVISVPTFLIIGGLITWASISGQESSPSHLATQPTQLRCKQDADVFYPSCESKVAIQQMIKNNYNGNRCGPLECTCEQTVAYHCSKPFHTVCTYSQWPNCPFKLGNLIVAYGNKFDCPEYKKTINDTYKDLQYRKVPHCKVTAQELGIKVGQDEFFAAVMIKAFHSSNFVHDKQFVNTDCVDKSKDWPWLFNYPCDVRINLNEEISGPEWVNKTCKKFPGLCTNTQLKKSNRLILHNQRKKKKSKQSYR